MTNSIPGGSGRSVTAAQLKLLLKQIKAGKLTAHHIESLLDHQDPFAVIADKDSQLEDWGLFLSKTFNIGIDRSSLDVPEHRDGFDRLIVVPKGITLNQVATTWHRDSEIHLQYGNLDSSITHNDRQPIETYCVWIRDRIEADGELAGKSAMHTQIEKIAGITLLERMLYERKYFFETGKCLDVDNMTLCTGSRDSEGGVPCMFFASHTKRLCVDWFAPSRHGTSIRSREVICRNRTSA